MIFKLNHFKSYEKLIALFISLLFEKNIKNIVIVIKTTEEQLNIYYMINIIFSTFPSIVK